jgi:hypothetical protein
MSDQFQHVMVLTSIIIGLGITNVLLGVSGAIERYTEGDRPLQLSWASAFWLAQVFLWMILFWWWEFRLVDILKHWTLWNYLLIICYAVALFLLVALLIPKDWDKVDNLNAYFLSKRLVLFSLPAWPGHRCDGLIYEGRLDLCHRTGRVGLGIFCRWYSGGSHWISLKAHSHAYDNGNRVLCLAGSPRVRRFPLAPSLDLTNR